MTLSRRQKRVWVSVVMILLGLALLGVLGWLLNRWRDPNQLAGSDAVSSREVGSTESCPIKLVDVTGESGLDFHSNRGDRHHLLPEDMGCGVAWSDIDGDGDWDLYAVSSCSLEHEHDLSCANRLFLNDRGSFTEVPGAGGTALAGTRGMGVSFADYDNDGRPDLYLSNDGPNRLFRNLGEGRFEDVTDEAGVGDSLWSAGVTWGDVDRDGDLDLYVCNYVAFDWQLIASSRRSDMTGYQVPFTLNPSSYDPQPNRLYLNRGDGSFEECAARYGVANPEGRSLAAIFCDLNGDGWLDLYINNDVSTNRLYLNSSSFEDQLSFIDVSTETGTADPRGSMGLSVGRALIGERDHVLPDLFLTHWVAQENAYYVAFLDSTGKQLEYRDRTRQLLLGEVSVPYVGWGSAFADFDGDGLLEIMVNNGSTLEQKQRPGALKRERAFLFWNRGETFAEVGQQTPLSQERSGRGLAVADMDGDGDVDVVITENGGPLTLLRNDTPGRYLQIRLEAPDWLRFGARVMVESGGRTQHLWWGADVSYLSQHGRDLGLGLGDQDRADVTVVWADGRTQSERDLTAGLHVIARALD